MSQITRRQFLMRSASVSGSLICTAGFSSPATAARNKRAVTAPAMGQQARDINSGIPMNAWLRIAPDNTIWLAMPRSEMGQGIHMGLRMLVAEELGCLLETIELEDPDIAAEFANQTAVAETVPFRPDDEGFIAQSARSVMRKAARVLDMQITGGSTSTVDAWHSLRAVAAATRLRLEAAAANAWGVTPAEVSLKDGMLRATSRDATMTIGQAAALALQTPAPAEIRFRGPSQYRIIGSNPKRQDLRNKVDGSAVFGSDVRLPGQVYGVPRLCPVFGGTLKTLRNRDELLKRPGVIDVLELPLLATSGGILVIASGFWAARQAAEAADLEWFTPPQAAQMDSARVARRLESAVQADKVHWTYVRRGEANWANDSDTKPDQVAIFSAPFVAHATMEPMNATAWLRNGQLDVWAPTQGQGPARNRAAKVADLSADAVRIHTTYLGGGFGRRVESDFVALAAFAASRLPGRPVQVLWTREEDMSHDFYRPAAAARLQARVAKDGRLTHWFHRSASAAVSHQAFQRVVLPGVGPDKATVEGAYDHAYLAANMRVDHVLDDSGIPVGYWRSVGHSYQAFFVESFMDELANSAGIDPLTFRLKNLPANSRQARALQAACAMAGYTAEKDIRPAGDTALGMAVHFSFGSVVAQVVEVQRRATGKPRISRVWCAVDCGMPIHPDGIRQQMEGGILFALAAALYGKIDIDSGAVRQRNFDQSPLPGLAESPSIEVSILPSAEPPSGVGEIAVPPLAPALANALYRLTGQRQYTLPLTL